MSNTSDIRNGLCIKHNHDIYKIIEFLHVKPGKGPAFVRTKLKSLTSGKVIDNTFSAGHKIDIVRVETNKFQYLYNDNNMYHFMNTDDYNQISIEEKLLDNPQLMKEGEIVTVRKRAKGLFKFQESFKNQIMLTTVTGVAPIVSMMRAMNFNSADYNIWIYEGASFISEFGYLEELENVSKNYSNIKFIPTCSRPDDPKNNNWGGETGRVNEIFSTYLPGP